MTKIRKLIVINTALFSFNSEKDMFLKLTYSAKISCITVSQVLPVLEQFLNDCQK